MHHELHFIFCIVGESSWTGSIIVMNLKKIQPTKWTNREKENQIRTKL